MIVLMYGSALGIDLLDQVDATRGLFSEFGVAPTPGLLALLGGTVCALVGLLLVRSFPGPRSK